MKIIGSYVSPYVRKVLACMALKGIDDYEIDPITPFFGGEEFSRLSPLRRIPVLIHGDLVLNDSTVICAWLDEAYGGHPLLPADPADRAKARWLEEYADTRLGEILDQMSDLFFESLSLLLLVQTGFVSPLYLVAYLLREFWVTSIRRFMAGNGLNIRSSFAGKLKTNVIMWSLLFAFTSAENLLPAAEPGLGIFAKVALTAGIALGWWSAVDYTRQFFEGYDKTATPPSALPPTHVPAASASDD